MFRRAPPRGRQRSRSSHPRATPRHRHLRRLDQGVTYAGVDLSIPYTFYPQALPHEIAWGLFPVAMCGGAVVGLVAGGRRGWVGGIDFGPVGAVAFSILSMVASVVITFFVYDI